MKHGIYSQVFVKPELCILYQIQLLFIVHGVTLLVYFLFLLLMFLLLLLFASMLARIVPTAENERSYEHNIFTHLIYLVYITNTHCCYYLII